MIISLFLRVLAAQLLRFRLKICHRHIFQTPQQFSKSNALSIYFVFISLAQNAGLFFCLQCVFDYLFVPAGPRSTAAAVSAKNMPQAYFPNASIVLKEIIAYRYILYLSASHKMRGCFFVMRIRFLCYNCPVFCRAFLFKSG